MPITDVLTKDVLALQTLRLEDRDTPVHHGLVRVLPLLLVALAANVRVQLLQVHSCHVSAAPHRH